MFLAWLAQEIFSFTMMKRVYLHMEKFHEPLNLLHTGVSFSDNFGKNVRYDFRPFGSGSTYETSASDRVDFERLFPIAATQEFLTQDFCDDFRRYRKELDTKTILWGVTNKTWKEIGEFELEYLCARKYILGIYDCRHYTREFTLWSCNNATPVWNLNALWERI
tara:strand:- start:1643 stop:2134 length:492 start_codon:yes stop_codon:yes gene_type:complete